MRISSVKPPPGAYIIEDISEQPGKVLVRLFERAEKVSAKDYWVYDEYRIVVENTDTLQCDILNDYDALMIRAKAAEFESEPCTVDGDIIGAGALLACLNEIKKDARYIMLPDWIKERLEHIIE